MLGLWLLLLPQMNEIPPPRFSASDQNISVRFAAVILHFILLHSNTLMLHDSFLLIYIIHISKCRLIISQTHFHPRPPLALHSDSYSRSTFMFLVSRCCLPALLNNVHLLLSSPLWPEAQIRRRRASDAHWEGTSISYSNSTQTLYQCISRNKHHLFMSSCAHTSANLDGSLHDNH